MKKINKTRKGYLDIAKAIGIIIVLINHVELQLGKANFFLGVFFVSEFFLLAGMTFHNRDCETIKNFAIKKAKRLLLPYGIYSMFYLGWYSLRAIAGGSFAITDFVRKVAGCFYARNYIFPVREDKVYLMEIMNAPMWFLPALFLSLLGYFVLSKWLGDKKKWGVLTAFLLSMLCHYTLPILLPWSIDTALAMMPLLYFGEKLATKDYVTATRKQLWLLPLTLLAFVLLTTINGNGNLSIGNYGNSMLLYLIISFLGSFLCIMFSFFIEKYLHFLSKVLIIIGENTMDILCLHLFVFALMQTICGILNISTDLWLTKLLIIILGIIIPILVAKTYKLTLCRCKTT